MSYDCAKRCGIDGLIDERFAGLAVGVGSQEIKGKVHYTQVQIENQFFTNAFSVLANSDVDIIIGLDFMKRHQCNINLLTNTLMFPALNCSTRFLNEAEIP